jgi:lipopolysaccharide/colanic/teichoic acid biosynthesis glycosyltransferase
LSPVFLVVFLFVRLTMGPPAIFRQARAGLEGRTFTLFKFRTMKIALDTNGNDLPDCARLTRSGALLRETSLDELPQLWNVLKGEMSFVGPRPLFVRYLDRYSARQLRRHEVRPGITGWAQVNGRNAISWSERLELDVQYVEGVSLGLDLKILLRTVALVVGRRGVSSPGEATMSEFSGHPGD